MRLRWTARVCLVAAALLVSTFAFANEDERYYIALNIKVGDRIAIDTNSVVKQKIDVTQNGQIARHVSVAIAQLRKGVIEVLSVSDGSASAVKVTFDPGCKNTGGAEDDAGEKPFALAGQTVSVRRGSDGSVTTDLATAPDDQTLAELSRLVQPDRSIYPKKPVQVGDEWEADRKDMTRQFKLGPNDKVAFTCKLVGVKSMRGRQLAEISIAGNVQKIEQSFVKTVVRLDGLSRIDLATGEPVATDLVGRIEVSGTQEAAGADGNVVRTEVSGDGAMELHVLARLLNADTATTSPAKPSNSFTGIFEGDGLKAHLKEGSNGAIVGTLEMNGQSMQLVARVDGAKLTGTFQSEGNKFPFSAVFEGPTLLLSSENSHYKLNRKPNEPAPVAAPNDGPARP